MSGAAQILRSILEARAMEISIEQHQLAREASAIRTALARLATGEPPALVSERLRAAGVRE